MLKQKILDDIKQAMKDKNNFKRDTLRFLHSAIKQIEIDTRKDVDDVMVIKILQKSIKQRNDTITQCKEAKRDDLVQKEEQELEILEQYLPEQMSDEELRVATENIVKEMNTTSKKDMGKVMGLAGQRLSGRADGKRIHQAISLLLK